MNGTNIQIGNLFLLKMTMHSIGSLISALVVFMFGHVKLPSVVEVTCAVGFGIVAGVAGHFLGHYTRNPDREIPIVDTLVRFVAWPVLIFMAVAVTFRWPGIGLALWLMLTQAAFPSIAAWARPLLARLRLEHQAPAPARVRERVSP